MAGRRIGEAFIRLRPDTAGLSREAQPAVVKAGKATGSIFAGSFAGSFSGVLIGGLLNKAFSLVSGFARDAWGEAREAARIGRLTDAVIKSTGGAARVTAKHVEGLSDSLGEMAGVDDDAIQAGQNLLLTFTNIKSTGGVFDEAAKSALDMTAAMNNGTVTTEGYRGTILQIGKALNDPVRGMNSLRRAGVTFTEQQKAQIKTLVKSGKTMEAQKIILGELNKEFGGAAAAATDPAQKAQVAWANFKERIGGAVLPVVGKLALMFTSRLLPVIEQRLIPAVRELARWAAEKLGPPLRWLADNVLPKLQAVLAVVAGGLAKAGKWFTGAGLGAGVFRSALGGATAAILVIAAAMKVWAVITRVVAAANLILNAVLRANPIGIIITVLAALVAGLIYAYKHSETFRKIVQGAWRGIQYVAMAVGGWFAHTLWPLIQRVWNGIVFGVRLMVAGFTFYWNLARTVVSAVWGFIQDRIRTAMANIRLIVAGVSAVYHRIRDAFEAARAAVRDKVAAVVAFVRGLPGRILAALGNLAYLLYNAGLSIIQGLIDGIQAKMGQLIDKVRSVAKIITDHLPFSPAKKGPLSGSGNPMFAGRAIGRMLAEGIAGEAGAVNKAMARLVNPPPPAGSFAPGLAGVSGNGGVHIHLHNAGVIGSQRELDNWMVKSVDRLRRERRL